MKVIVLGATGMLGAYSCLALKQAGHDVVAVGRRSTDNHFFEAQGCEFVGGVSLEDKNTYKNLPTDIDAIVHMAGTMPAHADESPMPYVQSIVVGMVNLLEWAREKTVCRRIVFNTTPSDVGYLFEPGEPVQDDAIRSFPKNGGDHAVYAICKNAAVDILEHYQIAYGFKPCVFRHLTVYGWRPCATYFLNGNKKVLPYRQIIRNCLAGEKVEIWGDPFRKKELLYIDDFCEAIKLAVTSDVCGLFNLPGYKPYTLEEQILGFISVFSDGKSKVVYCPEKPSTPQNLLAGEKVKKYLGWQANCDWETACIRMYDEMKQNRFELLWGKKDLEDCVN
jgi:UDP-glucose 4-epimerase